MSRIDITIYREADDRALETTGFFKDTDIHAASDALSEDMQYFISELGIGIEFKADEFASRIGQLEQLEGELKGHGETNSDGAAAILLPKIQQTISFLRKIPERYELEDVWVEFL